MHTQIAQARFGMQKSSSLSDLLVCVCVVSQSNSSKGTFKKLVDVFSTSWKTAPCPGLPRSVKFAKLKKVRFIRRMLLQVPDSFSSSGVATEPEMKKSCERKGGGGPGGRCKRSQEGQNFLKREREGKKREGASEEIGPGAGGGTKFTADKLGPTTPYSVG